MTADLVSCHRGTPAGRNPEADPYGASPMTISEQRSRLAREGLGTLALLRSTIHGLVLTDDTCDHEAICRLEDLVPTLEAVEAALRDVATSPA